MLVVTNATLTSTIVVTVAVLNVTAAGYVIISKRSFKMIVIIYFFKTTAILKEGLYCTKTGLFVTMSATFYFIFLFVIFYCYSQKCVCNMAMPELTCREKRAKKEKGEKLERLEHKAFMLMPGALRWPEKSG